MRAQSGFSITSLLISIGAMAIGGLAMLNAIDANLRSQKTIESKRDLENVMNEIKLALRDPAKCPDIFRAADNSEVPVPPRNVGDASIAVDHITTNVKVIGVNDKLPSGAQLKTLELRPAANYIVADSNSYMQFMRLHMEGSRNLTSWGSADSRVNLDSEIIGLKTDQTDNHIISCGISSGAGPCSNACSTPLPGGICSTCAGGTEVRATTTLELQTKYWSGTPPACLAFYMYNGCSWIRDTWRNNTQSCPYAPGGTAAQYVVAKALDLNRACNNFCGGLNPGPSPKSCSPKRWPGWPSPAVPGPSASEIITSTTCGSGEGFNYGTYKGCLTANPTPSGGNQWATVFCECHK